jgi:16S rRNA (guanine527-N7)-methyltransferase
VSQSAGGYIQMVMSDSEFQDILQQQAGKLGMVLTPEMLEQMSRFCETLLSWNQKMHLVSKKDARPDRIARQIVDSLLLLHHFEILTNSRMLDLGSGAGFPAVPLKIARPDLEMVLAESTLKKCDYLQNLLKELNLLKISVFPDRARNLPKKRHGYFAYATAKASGILKEVWPEVFPFLKRGGQLLTYKGQKAKEEIRQTDRTFKELPGRVERIIPIEIKELDLGGSLISIRKL